MNSKNINNIILRDAKKTNDWLNKYFAKKESPSINLINAMKYSVLNGGKRIRASLVLSAARLSGDEKSSLPVAAAIEMVHSYSLIHDDLPAMDNSDLRRGKKSLHVKYNEATAILAGDALQSEAFNILSNNKIIKNTYLQSELVSSLSKAIGHYGMAGGQMLDMEGEKKGFNFEQVKEMIELKTGALISASVVMGSIIGGGSKKIRNSLYKFSKNLGFAFQIADDILDVSSKSNIIGKPTGSDLTREKSNLINLVGLNKASKLANDLIKEAKDELIEFGSNGLELSSLADYIILRKV